MAGYKISIENVRKLSHLNVDFEEIIREVMLSQGRRFCQFEKPKCEQEVEAQKTDTQQLKAAIALVRKAGYGCLGTGSVQSFDRTLNVIEQQAAV